MIKNVKHSNEKRAGGFQHNEQNKDKMQFNFNDGGRSHYFKATDVGDCVTRAIAIATGRDYKEVYNELAKLLGYTPRNGVSSKHVKKVMQHFGGVWTATMQVGSGCKTHLNENELPTNGRYVLSLSKHCTAIVDGVLNDTYDCSRDGKRCVYGYWKF